ncbi:hypothetical protein AAC387_Pa09g1292 [Persea americana]
MGNLLTRSGDSPKIDFPSLVFFSFFRLEGIPTLYNFDSELLQYLEGVHQENQNCLNVSQRSALGNRLWLSHCPYSPIGWSPNRLCNHVSTRGAEEEYKLIPLLCDDPFP